jgi:alkaline phosphatase D
MAMDRRRLLKLGGFITVSVATMGGLAACGGGSDGAPTLILPPPTTPSPPPDTTDLSPATGSNWKFPQSIASGDPKPDGILLWTRAVPADLSDAATANAGADFSIRLRVTAADNSALLGVDNAKLAGDLVVDAAVPVQARFDNTLRHNITGLAPGATYYYQFVAGDVASRVGCFKTAPAAGADVAQLKFAFLSCQDWSINHWGAFSAMAAEELDFIVHVGDYIYETVGASFQTGTVEDAHPALQLPDGTPEAGGDGAMYATTLADYRYLYKTYRTDPRLQAVHERFAMVATWDDHEFSDDCWGDAETYDLAETHQPDRRRSANRAWFEFMPADIVFDEADQSDIFNVRIYRDLKFGNLAHLVMTDERLYRSDHIIPEQTINPATGQALGRIGSRYMVPQATLSAVEAQKMAAAGAADPLALTSILGATQRGWWQDTMKNSTATWKLWGNEVSLLRMGVDGTNAIATLVSLQAAATLASNIGTALAQTAGNVQVAAAIVAAVTTGATLQIAGAAAQAIAVADASSQDTIAAATGAGLTPQQAAIAVAGFAAAKAATGAGTTAQVAAAAQAIAFAYVKPDVIANKAQSRFVIAGGLQTALAPFFQKYVLDADQWDGYNAERKALMKHLGDNRIRNVVALTGDIHAFFTGTVNDDFDAAGGGTPVMVDLVTAGISSDSFFHYLKDAVGSLSASLATLVFYSLDIPVPALGAMPVQVDANLLDHTLSSSATVTPASVAESLRVPLRGALAARGVPEAQLDATTSAVLTALQADATFQQQLVPLCQLLAGLDSNPWLRHVNTDAQGYAVVTLTPTALQCDFKQVNRLVAGKAPATLIANQVRAMVQKDVAAVTIVQPA